jgi:hypothetical protein
MSPAEASTNRSTSTVQIKKFNGHECYPDWAYFMKIYLKEEALWKIVAGIEKRPPNTINVRTLEGQHGSSQKVGCEGFSSTNEDPRTS